MAALESDADYTVPKIVIKKPTTSRSYFDYEFVVVGGGIAGVSCVEELAVHQRKILLISDSEIVQRAANVTRLTKNLDEFVVNQTPLQSLPELWSTVTTLHDSMDRIDFDERIIYTKKGYFHTFKYLCLCTGASPVVPEIAHDEEINLEEHVFTLRDQKSVNKFAEVVSKAKRGLVIGNGGIATEFVFEVMGIEVIWAMKDKSISKHFIDSGAAEFLLKSRGYVPLAEHPEEDTLNAQNPADQGAESSGLPMRVVPEHKNQTAESTSPIKREQFEFQAPQQEISSFERYGSALGPDWHKGQKLQGVGSCKKVMLEFETEIKKIYCAWTNMEEIREKFGVEALNEALQYQTYVELKNGKHFGVDFILSATGTKPNCESCIAVTHPEEGILVDHLMRTNIPYVYAAGDVAAPRWKKAETWFPMRLWTQARASGRAAAASMNANLQKAIDNDNRIQQDHPCAWELVEGIPHDHFSFAFETFGHSTSFFGFKVVLLGLYNGQGLSPEDQQIKLRFTIGKEYIKLILVNHRVRGAVLIGETGLEETIENLILNGLDISGIEEDVLNPSLDLEDYFD